MTKLCKHLLSVGACREALKWVGTRTARRAWLECDRANWLVWWAMSTEANRREDVVLVVCQCLRRAALRLPAGENRPQAALAAVESLLISPTAEHAAAVGVAIAAVEAAVRAAVRADLKAGRTALAVEHGKVCLIIRTALALPWTEKEDTHA